MGEVPVNQALAVTGSINQFGRVQPIGGVNEKIEGFFEVCRARGLARGQGVIIPAANLDNLMLSQEVRQAVAQGLFYIYAVSELDEALALLTGISTGKPGKNGQYPVSSVNGRVQQRLARLAKVQNKLQAQSDNKEQI